MLFHVGEVAVTTDDVIDGNALGHREEVEVFWVADVGLGLDGDVSEKAYVIDHFEKVVAGLGGNELVELLAGDDASDFVEFLLADIDLHVVTAQHVGQRREPLANHERNPEVRVEQNLHSPCLYALISA